MRRFRSTATARIIILTAIITLVGGCCSLPKHARHRKIVRTMLVTAYDAGPESCGWERKYGCIGPPVHAYGPRKGERKIVGMTADGSRARPGTIAADPKYPFGTRMYVPGYGWGVVHDRGTAIQGDHIDIFFRSHDDALEWGRKYLDVTIILPE
ncbi:MAG: 3D domain-containing protein [Deltaproteobacteria bacterium]|nr:3D domain-containing protein [Deltaproteobacteria bacterium]